MCNYYGVKLHDLLGRRRLARIAFPRMVGMYLSRETTSYSLEAIGKVYNRHHTAIIHGHSTIDELLDVYPELEMSVGYLKHGTEGLVDIPIPKAFMPYANCN